VIGSDLSPYVLVIEGDVNRENGEIQIHDPDENARARLYGD
jgi:hypothetical protein